MLWRGRRQSGNVEDRRGFSGRGIAVGGGLVGLVIYLLNMFLSGGDVSVQNNGPDLYHERQLTPEQQAAEEERVQFVKVVLAETEDVWSQIFNQLGSSYQKPTLVLYRDVVESACGTASSASGPFYCPGDQKVYIDLSFYEDLQQRFQVGGDFPMAYVIAHEIGHHVQNLLGVASAIHEKRGRVSESEYNKFSVKMELQADFYAGLWAHYAHRMDTILEEGDIQEALAAANAIGDDRLQKQSKGYVVPDAFTHVIGDDRLQKQSKGYVVPDAFTHGTSAQRMYWFKRGFESGDIRKGNTFDDESLSMK